METALSDMRKEHMPFTFLMPVSRELYRPFGFACIFRKIKQELNTEGAWRLKRDLFSREKAEMTARWMNQKLKESYEVYAFRNGKYLERLLAELESENGVLELLYEGERLAGIKADWGIGKKEQRFLLCGEEYLQKTGEDQFCIMGRIVDIQEFICVIRLTEETRAEEMALSWKWRMHRFIKCREMDLAPGQNLFLFGKSKKRKSGGGHKNEY